MKQIRLTQSKGFTLIELMITVAIVGILSVVAIPAYQDYVARSQVSEGLVLVSGAKSIVADYYAHHGEFPDTMSDVGYAGAIGKYIESTTIGENGIISGLFNQNANSNIAGKKVILTPKIQSQGNISWECSSDAKNKYLPSSCVSTSDSGSTPIQQPPFSGTVVYSTSLRITDGVITFSGSNPTVTKIDLDGMVHLTGSGVDLVLHPDGTLDIIAADNGGTRYFTDKSTIISRTDVLSPDGKAITLLPGFRNSPYRTPDYIALDQSYSNSFEAYRTNPTTENYNALNQAKQNALNYLSTNKDSSGNWPSDMPKAVIDYFSSNGNLTLSR